MTDNPIAIMLINMTIVFAVLAILNLFLRLIHWIDPTYKKPEEKVAPAPVAPAPAPAPVQVPPVVAPGISPETVAVIAASLAACGVGFSQVRAISPVDRTSWSSVGHSEQIAPIARATWKAAPIATVSAPKAEKPKKAAVARSSKAKKE